MSRLPVLSLMLMVLFLAGCGNGAESPPVADAGSPESGPGSWLEAVSPPALARLRRLRGGSGGDSTGGEGG